MTPQDVLILAGLLTGAAGVLGMGLGLVALAIHERGNR